MNIENMTLDQARAKLTPEGKAAFDIGVEKAFRLHFRALKRIEDKVYRLPQDAKTLETELLVKVSDLWDEERKDVPMIVTKRKEAVNG